MGLISNDVINHLPKMFLSSSDFITGGSAVADLVRKKIRESKEKIIDRLREQS
jgi:hypothetical protein